MWDGAWGAGLSRDSTGADAITTHIAHERQDNVSGVIIGGSFIGWQVVYDGRPQSGKEYADTSDEAEQAARDRIAALKREFCGAPCYLYASDLWTIRLWGG